MDSLDLGNLVYLLLLLGAVGGWAMVEYRGRMGFALRTALAWGLIFLGVAAGYGLWQDIRASTLSVQRVEAGRIEVPRGRDGHFHLTLEVAGTPVRFLVDTGATNVVLGRGDARRLRIDRTGLAFTGTAATANGTVRTARVTLADVALGPFRDDRIAAYVTDGDMEGSLLGMDYLRRYRIEIAGDRMVLTR
jgi:aspartyl protease family protein